MTKISLALALLVAATHYGCSSDSERPSPASDSGVRDTGQPAELCGPLNPTGPCAAGFRCYAGNCFADTEFCSPQNLSGLCLPSEDCTNGACVPKSMLCSATNPTGTCDPGTTCRAGQCIGNALLCLPTNPTGLCADPARSCLEGTCVLTADLCSPSNLTGTCPGALTCIQGACSTPNPCAPTEPQGFCTSGNTCIDGTCTANGDLCTAANQTGICIAGRTCIDGNCTADNLLCSASQPTGLCPTGAVCFETACVQESALCSATNVTGLCQAGQSCISGSCVNDSLVCSPTNPTGACQTGDQCINGTCVNATTVCSPTNPTGTCQTGQTCVDGTCAANGTLCSPTNPTGVCSGTFTCFSGACTDPTTLCSVSNPTGLCANNEICNAGVCETAGSCANCAVDQTCLDSVCRDNTTLCSQANPTGLCESGFDCIAGTCIDAGIGCSQNNQSGVCPSRQICNAGVCEPIDDAALCNDHNPCTRDWFDYARNRCAHDNQVASCSDGNACTTDVCSAGTCTGSPIGGCIEPPTIDPYVTPTNVSVLNLSGTKPSGASIQINGLSAVPQNPDTTWSVVLNLVPGTNTYVINSVDQGQASATIQVDVVYDITPPVTSLTPAGGVFLNGVTVRVASDEAATVYYSTDGAEPDQYSPRFQSVKEFRVFDTSRLRFRALDQAGNWEANILTADYEITGHGNGWSNGPLLAESLIHVGVTTRGNSVYVVGGSDGLAPQAGSYGYDHVADAWTTLPSMPAARAQLAMATVGDRIYAIGGENNGVPLGTVASMDLSQGTLAWTALAPMPSTRFGLSAVTRGSSIHVFGGKTNGGAVLTNHEVFNTSTGVWTNQVAQMPRARYAFSAVIHADKIYLVGGEDLAGTPIAEVDVYDAVANTWGTALSLPTPRSFAAIGLLKNEGAVNGGHAGIVVAGGRVAGGGSTPIVEEYIIEDNTWRQRSPMDAARHSGPGVTVLRQGGVDTIQPELWFVGGQLPSGLTDQVVAFGFSQDHVRHLGPMPEARFMHAAAALNSKIYLFGGRNFTEELDAWEFDPETDTYRALPALATFQSGLRAVALGDYVYAIGGADNFGNSVANLRAYDPVQNMWINKAPLQVARRDAAVAVLGTEIWVIGGSNGGALQTVEVYDTLTNMWRSETVLPTARTGAMAIAREGNVYVLGGLDAAGNEHTSMLRYNGGAWSVVTPNGFGVAHASAFLIGDAQLSVFAGRIDGAPVDNIIGYNLGSNSFGLTYIANTKLIETYDYSAGTVLFGKVYLFGGNSTALIGPSGETVVQKVEGRCYNGVLDGREVAGANGYDSGGGCATTGIEHSTGLGLLFYNNNPVSTTTLQRAIDACNAHYGITTCARSCPTSGCFSVTRAGDCNCNDPSFRWNYGTSCYGSNTAGQVSPGSTCNSMVSGNWY